MIKGITIPINLPIEAYISDEWFKREQELIFSRTWQFGGFIEDIPNAGDYITVQVGLYNIFVVRGSDNQLRAFHNICRHRGTQLLHATGNAEKLITCPYHDWTYSLSGELIGVPEQEQEFPDLEFSKLCLHKASVKIWMGMIWIHSQADAQSLSEWMREVKNLIGPHRPEELIEDPESKHVEKINANWKIVVENYIDEYHLAHLHSETLDMYDHQNQISGFEGPHFHFYEPLAPDYLENIERASPTPMIDHFTKEKPIGAYVPFLFPNTGIGADESSWSVFHVQPISVDETIVVIRSKVVNEPMWKFNKQATRSYDYFKNKNWAKYPNDGDNHPMNTGDFIKEDTYAYEQQQKSFNNPLFSIGATALTQEASVRDFQQVVKNFMEEQEKTPSLKKQKDTNKDKQPIASQTSVQAQLKTEIDNVYHEVKVQENQTLLAALLQKDIKAPHSCQAGICGKCKAKLKKGEVRTVSQAALSEKEIRDGFILPCQSSPKSEKIEIKYVK